MDYMSYANIFVCMVFIVAAGAVAIASILAVLLIARYAIDVVGHCLAADCKELEQEGKPEE